MTSGLFIILLYAIIFSFWFFCSFFFKKRKYFKNYTAFIEGTNYDKTFLYYKDFVNYYNINKNKWCLSDGKIFYTPSDEKKILIVFNKKDLYKVNRYISELITNNQNNFNAEYKENLVKLLESVQSDIDEMKEQSRKEKEEASRVFMNSYKNLVKEDLVKEEGSNLDAFINASKTDC